MAPPLWVMPVTPALICRLVDAVMLSVMEMPDGACTSTMDPVSAPMPSSVLPLNRLTWPVPALIAVPGRSIPPVTDCR